MSDQVASPYIQAVQVSSVSSASEYHLHTDNSVSNATLSTAPTEEDNTVEDSPIDVAFKWDLGYSTNIDVLEDAYWSQQQQQQQRVSRDYSLIQDLIRAANEPKQHLDCPSLWTKAAHSGRSSYTRIEQSVQSNQFAYPSTLENIDSTSVEEGMEH
ncbi:MAG: hypothetical protein M1821_001120 [Bathelium mastoideum]|nr:MAG: hypothetical protein M1821_001120 [Bathelium mastoideum]